GARRARLRAGADRADGTRHPDRRPARARAGAGRRVPGAGLAALGMRRPGRGGPAHRDYVRPMTAIRLLLVDDDPLVRAGLSLMMGGADDIEIVGEAGD